MAAASPRVVIAILNWNGLKFLKQFLPGVIRNTPDYAKVCVIDNDSSDDSVTFLERDFPNVEIVRNAQNYGYAGGYNVGLSEIDADYYVLLNSDVEVAPGWLDPMVQKLDSDKRIGACQPKVLDLNERDRFEYAGAAGGYIDILGYPFCRGRIFDAREKDKGQYDDSGKVFWATGACMTVRSDVFHSMGGFEASSFAHMEEIDLCWRMQNAGYQIWAVPAAMVYHLGGGSLPAAHPGKAFLNYRNNLMMLARNLHRSQLPWVLLIRLVLDGIAALQALFSGKVGIFFAVLRAHFAFYGRIPDVRKHRRMKVNFSRIQELPGVFKGSIVWQFFIRKKKLFSDLS